MLKNKTMLIDENNLIKGKERIIKNEKMLDSALLSVKKLEEALETFKLNKKNIDLVNKYYGSKNWYKDREALEANRISVKAGILSEDAVWNMNEDIKDLILEMKDIISNYKIK